MSRDIAPDVQKIQLYLTEPHPCSYLADQQATTAFVDPKFEITDDVYDHLSQRGFRRSGQYVYTPRCANCKNCLPVRVPVNKFVANKQQRRCLKKNADVNVTLLAEIDTDEHYAIYEKYISARHHDGDMYPATPEQYRDFIGRPWECTRFIEFRQADRLLCCAVVDQLASGLSAIYTYFDPDEAKRSLGTLAILKEIEIAKDYALDYVYLGYWIRDSAKMRYKSNFRPAQLFTQNSWLEIG